MMADAAESVLACWFPTAVDYEDIEVTVRPSGDSWLIDNM